MVAMETGHFLKMLNDASLASLGLLMWKVLGSIICKKNYCGYSRARLIPSAARLVWLRRPCLLADISIVKEGRVDHGIFVLDIQQVFKYLIRWLGHLALWTVF